MSHRPQGPLPSAQLSVPLLLQQLPPASCVTATSWPEVLRTVCYLLPICKPTDGAGGGADVTSAAVEGLAKLPFSYLLYFPTRTFMGEVAINEWLMGILMICLWASLFFIAVHLLRSRGLKQYSGVGI